MLLLFLDESGDHSLEKIDPQYPVFVLGGCIVDSHYHQTTMTSMLRTHKRDLFKRDDFILHTADVVRRRGPFHKLTDSLFRQRFYDATNRLMSKMDYTVVACAILKDEHLRRYGLAAIDPYMLSLRILVERFVFEVQHRAQGEPGHIIAEARDETLDNQLRLAWMDLRTSGTAYVSAAEVRRRVAELHIRRKADNIAGLQVADLVVSPIGRYLLGKEPKADWQVIVRKFRRGPKGQYLGYGLVTLPKEEGRRPNDSVTAHNDNP